MGLTKYKWAMGINLAFAAVVVSWAGVSWTLEKAGPEAVLGALLAICLAWAVWGEIRASHLRDKLLDIQDKFDRIKGMRQDD